MTTLTLTDSQLTQLSIALVRRHREKTKALEFFRSATAAELGVGASSAEFCERDLTAIVGIIAQLPDWAQRFVADEIAETS
jgi:hypothetical protein